MKTPGEVRAALAASLLSALGRALGLGLPAPDHITLSPCVLGPESPQIGLQFIRTAEAVRAWGGHFGAPVESRPSAKDPDVTWVESRFTFAHARFRACTRLTAAQT